MEILEYHHNLIRLMRPTNFGMERVQRACLPPKLDAAPSTKKKNFDAQPEAKLPIFQRKKLVIIYLTQSNLCLRRTRNAQFSATSYPAIYDDCSILWSEFDEASIEYCNREANSAEH
jgi:hypothetical protein